MKKPLYLILAVAGFVHPYYFIYRFYASGETNFLAAGIELSSTGIGALVAADLLVSVLASWTFFYFEARRLRLARWWLYPLATVAVGLSFALPLFMYFREKRLEEMR
jgi:hypothetical protein